MGKAVIEEDRVMVVEAVIDPVYAGKRLTNDTEEKAWEVPWPKIEPFKASKII